jgi:hypothetical protein
MTRKRSSKAIVQQAGAQSYGIAEYHLLPPSLKAKLPEIKQLERLVALTAGNSDNTD